LEELLPFYLLIKEIITLFNRTKSQVYFYRYKINIKKGYII